MEPGLVPVPGLSWEGEEMGPLPGKAEPDLVGD